MSSKNGKYMHKVDINLDMSIMCNNRELSKNIDLKIFCTDRNLFQAL